MPIFCIVRFGKKENQSRRSITDHSFIPIIIMSLVVSNGFNQLIELARSGLSKLIGFMFVGFNIRTFLSLVTILFLLFMLVIIGVAAIFLRSHRRILLMHALRDRFRATALMDEEEFTDTQLEERMDLVDKNLSFKKWNGDSTRTNNDSCKSHENNSTQCSICLNDFQKGDFISWSKASSCNHLFHKECIHAWLVRNIACPMCRTTFLPEMTESEEMLWNSVRE